MLTHGQDVYAVIPELIVALYEVHSETSHYFYFFIINWPLFYKDCLTVVILLINEDRQLCVSSVWNKKQNKNYLLKPLIYVAVGLYDTHSFEFSILILNL